MVYAVGTSITASIPSTETSQNEWIVGVVSAVNHSNAATTYIVKDSSPEASGSSEQWEVSEDRILPFPSKDLNFSAGDKILALWYMQEEDEWTSMFYAGTVVGLKEGKVNVKFNTELSPCLVDMQKVMKVPATPTSTSASSSSLSPAAAVLSSSSSSSSFSSPSSSSSTSSNDDDTNKRRRGDNGESIAPTSPTSTSGSSDDTTALNTDDFIRQSAARAEKADEVRRDELEPNDEVDVSLDEKALSDEELTAELEKVRAAITGLQAEIKKFTDEHNVPKNEDNYEIELIHIPDHCMPIRTDVRKFDFDGLAEQCQFDVITMDPPWQLASAMPTRGVALGYAQLPNSSISDIPVPKLQKNGLLFIWVINSRYNFALEMFRQWGYTMVDDITWVKSTVNRRLAKGHGYYLQHAKETCLVGMKGTPPANMNGNAISDVIFAERRGQSQKPTEIYEIIEQLVPNGKYLEIFARRNNLRNHWVSIGLEL